MQIGDMYVYIDRIEDEIPIRLLAMIVRIDNEGIGLELPVLTCMVYSAPDDANRGGAPFLTNGGLWPFGSNNVGTFEPIVEA